MARYRRTKGAILPAVVSCCSLAFLSSGVNGELPPLLATGEVLALEPSEDGNPLATGVRYGAPCCCGWLGRPPLLFLLFRLKPLFAGPRSLVFLCCVVVAVVVC